MNSKLVGEKGAIIGKHQRQTEDETRPAGVNAALSIDTKSAEWE